MSYHLKIVFGFHGRSNFVWQGVISTGEKEPIGGDLGEDGWIILGWISRRWDVGIWTGLG